MGNGNENNKIPFEIKQVFTTKGNKMYGKGVYELDAETAERFKKEGRGDYVNADDNPKSKQKTAPAQKKQQEGGAKTNGGTGAPNESDIPGNFVRRGKLIAAGFDTIEKLKAAKQEEIAKAVEGDEDAAIVGKIGLAIEQLP